MSMAGELRAAPDAVAGQARALAAPLQDLTARLIALGADRVALVGGLAPHLEAWLAPETRRHLAMPEGDALAGALQLARAEATAVALEA